MKYYEIQFYYYGEEDERTDMENEFSFYIKIDRVVTSTEDLKSILNERMNSSDIVESRCYKYWLDGHLDNISIWSEISATEFTACCGVPA